MQLEVAGLVHGCEESAHGLLIQEAESCQGFFVCFAFRGKDIDETDGKRAKAARDGLSESHFKGSRRECGKIDRPFLLHCGISWDMVKESVGVFTKEKKMLTESGHSCSVRGR